MIQERVKLVNIIHKYFDSISADPLSLAHDLSFLPENIQEKIFDLCMAFIFEIAEKDRSDVYSKAMIANRLTAQKAKRASIQ